MSCIATNRTGQSSISEKPRMPEARFREELFSDSQRRRLSMHIASIHLAAQRRSILGNLYSSVR